jgi:hypothetical protein
MSSSHLSLGLPRDLFSPGLTDETPEEIFICPMRAKCPQRPILRDWIVLIVPDEE